VSAFRRTVDVVSAFRRTVGSDMAMKARRLATLGGCAAVMVVVVLLLVRPSSAQNDDLDVLKVIPENYKLVLENPFVRVLEARIPAGTEEKPHRHLRGVSVCMTEYTLESRVLPGGEWVRSQRKAGVTYWSDASLHQVRNVGTTQSHTIRIELKY
jgi:hypothetical protein